MNKIFIFILYIGMISKFSMGQEINIIKTDSSSEQLNLSDINNITLSLESSSDDNQKNMLIHTPNTVYQLITEDLGSIYFNDDANMAIFQTIDTLYQLSLGIIDSITYSNNLDSTVYITYNGTSVSVSNPLAFLGVSIEVSNADVIVNSTADISNLNYVLSGTTGDGMFKIYSDKKLNLYLNEIEISNSDGPAINIQTGKKITVHLEDGTTNILNDGKTYAAAIENEDQDAAFFSEGQLVFTGSGNLEINGSGSDQHGLRSDDYIEIDEGVITVSSAVKDGVHTNDGFYMYGGTLNVTSEGDGIDGSDGVVEITSGSITINNTEDDNSAMKSDSTISITGGTLNITIDGDQSKGINAKQDIEITGGTLNIVTSGGAVLEASGSGYDPSYCTAIKTDEDVLVKSCTITINTYGEAGRGISCDGDLIMNSGKLQISSNGDGARYTNEDGESDAYHGPCIKTDGDFNLIGGELTLNHSGKGGKGISTDDNINIGSSTTEPSADIITTGQSITISGGGGGRDASGDYAEAKAIKADSAITIESGDITISSTDDGIKSEYWITINGGTINITKSVEGIESPNIFVNSGEVNINASDDGFNATYGNGGEADDGSNLTINDGYIYVNASGGDALDSNGDMFINGGTIVVHGPQSDPEVGADINGDFKVNGGFLVVSGTNSNMTEGPISSSDQYSVLLRTNQSISAGTLIHIEDDSGNSLVTFAPKRTYYSLIFSSVELSNGTTYKIYTGGSSTGTLLNGLYTGGSYSGGTLKTTFTLSSIAQTVWF